MYLIQYYTVRLRKQNAFFIIATRHGVILALLCVVIVLIIINFFSQYVPVFQVDPAVVRHKDNQFRKQLFFSEIRNVNEIRNSVIGESRLNVQSHSKQPQCEVVHVGVVCSGYKSNLYFHTVLKSIYFHSNNPFHFHIIVNKFSEKVLKTLFETWAVPKVRVNFYNVSDYISDVRWVPNGHYSGVYGLLKLLFPKIVPLNITNKIIVLDTDLTFMGNIYELWQEFSKFKKQQVIGLVENQSDYYLGKLFPYSPWPAVGRGFNTGIILYHLERLKTLEWDKLWVRVAKKTASLFGATRLADQDIINTVIKQDQDMVYHIGCNWNVQLSDHTQSNDCYNNFPIKVVHWNSPKKFNVFNPDAEYFRTVYKTFLDLNGHLLKRSLFDCENISKNITEPPIDLCYDFRKAQFQKWRTLLFFREFKYVPTKDDVTMLVQLSFDRIQMVEELCKYWEGPLSLTFYVTDPEFQESIHFIENSEVLQDRMNIAYHAVFKQGDYHPINELRNIGLRQITTPYVFLADADFLPMHDLYSVLKEYLGAFNSMSKKALIIPAFETQRYRSSVPRNKKELLQMLDNKSVFTFRYDVWPVGHSPVNYIKWRTAQGPYKVKWHLDFEPYVVVQANVTEYDKRFLGFGWNKVSHIMELEAQGYEFIVLPNAFIIHKTHAPSSDIGKFRNSPVYRMCLLNLKEEFVESLNKKFGWIFDHKNISLSMGS
ncbi:hypothetical protein FQA39_LY04068 [Lamprigera yunnana]|nr:hypothetical protein FQA39_LY04068 [Lamprigera yunnana]